MIGARNTRELREQTDTQTERQMEERRERLGGTVFICRLVSIW